MVPRQWLDRQAHQLATNCAIETRVGLPFLPCFFLSAVTCASVKPVEGCTSKADKTWSTGFAKAFSIFLAAETSWASLSNKNMAMLFFL